MFRCDNCGSGYSMKAAASWESCPRCLAKERINVPLSFELGWRGRDEAQQVDDAQLAAIGLPYLSGADPRSDDPDAAS